MENQVVFRRFNGGRTLRAFLHRRFIDFCNLMVYFWLVHTRMKIRSRIVLSLLAVFAHVLAASGNPALGQGITRDSLGGSKSEYGAILDDVEVGISTSNVGLLAKHFAPQVGINLRGDENGTFSSNQAYYVLMKFFRTRKFARLQFSTVGASDSNPYATGGVEFMYKGAKARAQVYVALMIEGRKHVITQLSIY